LNPGDPATMAGPSVRQLFRIPPKRLFRHILL